MNVTAQAPSSQLFFIRLTTVGTIGPEITRGIFGQHVNPLLAIVPACCRQEPRPLSAVHAGKSVHKPGSACVGYRWQCASCSQSGPRACRGVGFLVLPSPTGFGALLRLYSLPCAESQGTGFKTLRGLARFDLCVFLPAVALPGHIHKTCIHDLTLLGAAALRDPLLIAVLEQGFMAFMPGQLRSKQPDGPGIRNLVFQVAP